MMRTAITVIALAAAAAAMTVDDILDRMEANENPASSRVEMRQTVTGADERQSVSTLVSYSIEHGDKSLMEYVTPARIQGMKILMHNGGDDIWFYSPRTARVRKIASHQKNQSVNNSDFTYDDLSTKDRRTEYDAELIGIENHNGLPFYRIEMNARSSDQTYGRMEMWVDTASFVSNEIRFYDQHNTLWKKLFLKEIEQTGAYRTPRRIEMHDVQKGSSTLMEMLKVEYDVPLDAAMFTERHLQR